jgi:CheY-like chemotaxis protein
MTARGRAVEPFPRLLVVEGDGGVRRLIARVLRSSFEITALESAAEVLPRLDRGARFDVVLWDVSPTDRASFGILLTACATAEPFTKRLVLMVSIPNGLRIDLGGAIELLILTKPFTVGELRNAVALRSTGKQR